MKWNPNKEVDGISNETRAIRGEGIINFYMEEYGEDDLSSTIADILTDLMHHVADFNRGVCKEDRFDFRKLITLAEYNFEEER